MAFDGHNHLLSVLSMPLNTDCSRLDLGKRKRKGAMYRTGVAYIEHTLIQVKLKKGLKFLTQLNTRSQVHLPSNLTNWFITVLFCFKCSLPFHFPNQKRPPHHLMWSHLVILRPNRSKMMNCMLGIAFPREYQLSRNHFFGLWMRCYHYSLQLSKVHALACWFWNSMKAFFS